MADRVHPPNQGAREVIDSYAHVGTPRFGTAEQAHRFLAASGISRMALVLFPGAPDLPQIDAAHAALGEDVRVFGMPYGANEDEVVEIVEAQIEAGVAGFRFQPNELLAYPRALELVGRNDRILYATNPSSSPEACRAVVSFLDRHPDAAVASPHFLRTSLPNAGSDEAAALEPLLSNPRFTAIFSRHGGMGTVRPYPHEDYGPWVDLVVDRCGWDRIMWGSEYPVLFWRNETIGGCIDWLEAIRPALFAGPEGRAHKRAYLAGNAERLLFSRPSPPRAPIRIPRWLAGRFDPSGSVPLFPKGISVPMPIYSRYLDGYLERLATEPRLTFEQFMVEALAGNSSPDLPPPSSKR